jgi:hypothetical protein
LSDPVEGKGFPPNLILRLGSSKQDWRSEKYPVYLPGQTPTEYAQGGGTWFFVSSWAMGIGAAGMGKTNQRSKPVEIAKLKTRYELEDYTPERIAEFLLSNAVDAEDYAESVAEVRRMGLDPDKIPHQKPAGV